MALKADFIKDVAAHCSDMLTAAGYMFQTGDDRNAIRTYESIRHRRIPTRQRTMHRAPYTVPPHLAAGEEQLLAKVVAGGDLWPHQSRRIVDVAAEDAMLNDYGIQHFHLGTTPDRRRPQLIEGTIELLFAVVKDNDFYVLGIFDHTAWSKQALLDIIQANWPELIAPHVIPNVLGLSRNYTEAEVAALRKSNINVIQQRPDGTVHLGMGGGFATNGKSMAATTDAIKLADDVKRVQDDVVTRLEDKVSAAGLPSDTLIRLEWRGDAPFAVTVPAACELDLTGILVILPL